MIDHLHGDTPLLRLLETDGGGRSGHWIEGGLRLTALLQRLDRFQVVILDDLGYVQQSREEMEVLFTFFAERYERRSVMISSNLVFSQWDQIFKDPLTTMAAVDRLVHHAHILEFDNQSIRASQAKKRPRD